MLVIGVAGTELTAQERDWLQHDACAGVILFKRNFASKTQVAELSAAIREAAADVVAIIRGGGSSQDFEVFDDARVIVALAEQRAHRVVGLGHTGNTSLLELVADVTANTPAQAGTYIRERVQHRQRMLGDLGRELRLVKERAENLEKERNIAQSQLQTASELLAKAQGGVPYWAAAAAFVAGAALAWVFGN